MSLDDLMQEMFRQHTAREPSPGAALNDEAAAQAEQALDTDWDELAVCRRKWEMALALDPGLAAPAYNLALLGLRWKRAGCLEAFLKRDVGLEPQAALMKVSLLLESGRYAQTEDILDRPYWGEVDRRAICLAQRQAGDGNVRPRAPWAMANCFLESGYVASPAAFPVWTHEGQRVGYMPVRCLSAPREEKQYLVFCPRYEKETNLYCVLRTQPRAYDAACGRLNDIYAKNQYALSGFLKDAACVQRTFDLMESVSAFLFAEEYFPHTLYDYIARNGNRLDPAAAVGFSVKILDALTALHGARIPYKNCEQPYIYRSLTPNTVLLSADLEKDGLPAVRLAAPYLIQNDEKAAEIRFDLFMPCPENVYFTCPALTGNRPCKSPAADVWSAAAVLYTMLAGLPPKVSGERANPQHTQRTQQVVPFSARGVEVQKPLAEVIYHALPDTLEEGYQTPEELKEAILKSCNF